MSNLFINRLIAIEEHQNRWENFSVTDANYKETYDKYSQTGLAIKPNDTFWFLRQINSKTSLCSGAWGTKQSFAKDRLITTTQSEHILSSSFWKKYSDNRCLIPVTAYFEWQMQPNGKKHKFKIEFKDKNSYFARIFGSKSDSMQNLVTFITQVANEKTAEIHNSGDNKHRQPVVIQKENQNQWLNSKITNDFDLQKLITQFQSNEIITEDLDYEQTLFG
ncbi:SOS response-associated peptidase family protein [Leptospira kanakyensis]|uniref:SOS response-associated peptidase family protein n=1 Tax=Leptospira kanakyensis TaxID=2484968 RepID=UPI00223E816A|nr:SOS response-associated peptidase family protein [Leptospira kanakyensis]MCW7482556.1 SOS response-associated peptidase [Leptospira kanakyensis]